MQSAQHLSTRIWGKVCPATQHLSALYLDSRTGQAVAEVGGGRKKRPQLLAALNRQLAAGTTSGGERDASLQPD